MSMLPWDPHPRTTKKPSASTSTSTAAQLLLRRGGRAAAKDESIEFFSALRRCQPEPHVSGQTERGPADGRGNVKRGGGGGGGGDDERLSTEIGKHDYDWLLTPPASPLWSPATSAAGHQVSAAVPSRLSRAGSASYAKSNSRLSLSLRENENPTSRLRSSSATDSSVNTPAIASSGCLPYVRTLSSASSSSVNTASNASVSSTPLVSAATSHRTPGTTRSAAGAAARSRRRDKTQARGQVSGSAAGQPKGSPSKSGPLAPTSTRPRTMTGASSPRPSGTPTSQQPALARRGFNAVARSRFAIQSTTGSTAQAASPEPQPRDVSSHGARSSIMKPRPLPVDAKQCPGNRLAAVSTTTQRWRPFPSPSVAVAQSAPSRDLLANRSSRNGDGRKLNVDKATRTTPHRTARLVSAAMSTSLTRTSSRRSANTNAKLTVNENDGAPVHQRSIRSVAPRSRLVFMVATPDSGSTAGGRSTSEKGKLTGAAAARVAEPDAFPSTRYDAMLLREDPKNLTWLHGCSGDDDDGGACLVEGPLEPFDAPAGMSGTAVRF